MTELASGADRPVGAGPMGWASPVASLDAEGRR